MDPIERRQRASVSRLAWSNLSAQSAEQIALAAAPLVAVLMLGADEGMTGLLQVAFTLPFLLLAIPAGLLADRYSKTRLMAAAEGVRALALIAIVALLQAGLVKWAILAVLGFLASAATVVFSVAAPSYVAGTVATSMLAMANARVELSRTLAFAAGPAAGGAVLAWAGPSAAFGLAASLALLAAAGFAALPEPRRAAPPRSRRPLREIVDGVAFTARNPLLRPVLATQFVFNVAFFILLAVYVPYAVRHLGLSPTGVGLTLAIYGGGMVAGAILAPSIMRRLPFGIVVVIGPIAGLAAAVMMSLTIVLPTPALAGSSFLLFGIGPIIWVISTTTLRQAVTPHDLQGRVAAISVLTYGARSIGAGLGALIGLIWGAEACLVAAVVGFLIQATLILMSPVVGLASQPVPSGDHAASALTPGLPARSL